MTLFQMTLASLKSLVWFEKMSIFEAMDFEPEWNPYDKKKYENKELIWHKIT